MQKTTKDKSTTRIERLKNMQQIYQDTQGTLIEIQKWRRQKSPTFLKKLRALTNYYHGKQWMEDIDWLKDHANQIPKNLSIDNEDAIWDLLIEIDSEARKLTLLTAKILTHK